MNAHEHEQHYRRYRSEIERALDADFESFRAGRAAPENAPLAPPDEGPVASFGRAVAEVFTAPEAAGGDAGLRDELVAREGTTAPGGATPPRRRP